MDNVVLRKILAVSTVLLLLSAGIVARGDGEGKRAILQKIDKTIKEENDRFLKEIEKVLDEELHGKTVRKPGYLGIYAEEIDDETRKRLGLSAGEGVGISAVQMGAPAEKAGLQEDDVIIAIGGKTVSTVQGMIETIKGFGAGEKVEMVVLRDGKRKSIPVLLAAREEEAKSEDQGEGKDDELREKIKKFAEKKEDERKREGQRGWLGVQVENAKGGAGVVVTQVIIGSPAHKGGIREDDVLVKINGTRVEGEETLGKIFATVRPGDSAEIVLLRKGKEKALKVALEARGE